MRAGEVVDGGADGDVVKEAGVAEVVDVEDKYAKQGDAAQNIDV